jgi:hypothetical protein
VWLCWHPMPVAEPTSQLYLLRLWWRLLQQCHPTFQNDYHMSVPCLRSALSSECAVQIDTYAVPKVLTQTCDPPSSEYSLESLCC